MKTKVTPTLRKEAREFCLHFACTHCAYFDPRELACSEGYPNEEHRDAELAADSVLFCKLFELK